MTKNLIRLAGVFTLLIILFAALGYNSTAALGRSNLYEVFNRQGYLGVVTLGVALLIITGNIDLSIGSVIGFSAMLFGVLMESGFDLHFNLWLFRIDIVTGPVRPYKALAITIFAGVIIGLINGLLITRLRLQAFLVTLCGMFVYRGFARQLSAKNTGVTQVTSNTPEFESSLRFLESWLVGKDADGAQGFPMMLVVLLVLALVLGLILHGTAYGRYWYAIGYNEQAARYAGVNVERQKLIVFVICSTLAAFGGVLWILFYGVANPTDVGNSYELYAITAAVLGGCSLRGGEGLMIGFVLGALVQPLLRNLIIYTNLPSQSEPWVMGLILLLGTIIDELLRRQSAKK
jgi:ribose transport system permease protein